ncbi:MAG: TraR/DksA family transcriptional regulator [Planctomycetes bacterium]|nr:TraR/DksA family transcriptional regulator [Planctomycetota bacterium]
MPNAQMKKKDLDHFEALLQARRRLLARDVGNLENQALAADKDDVSVDHMADYGSDQYEQEFTLGLMQADVATLRLIDEALERIKVGAFGVCVDCQELIPRERLEALPYVLRCVPCKEKHERETEGITYY